MHSRPLLTSSSKQGGKRTHIVYIYTSDTVGTERVTVVSGNTSHLKKNKTVYGVELHLG